MKNKLSNQLALFTILAFLIIVFSIGILVPKSLEPFYEENVYTFLKQPQRFIRGDNNEFVDGMAFILIDEEGEVEEVSKNYDEIVSTDNLEFISLLEKKEGKLEIAGNTYYYAQSSISYPKKIITLTNESYINEMEKSVQLAILPIIIVTFIMTLLILSIWSKRLVNKIEIIKEKVLNIKNKKYNHAQKIVIKDELYDLESMVEETRLELLDNEQYKNEMFQNISHDLKTPISVIKSYIEAIDDKVETPEKGLKVINKQTNKLEAKVESLLYLNKLEYYKDKNPESYKKINISKLIKDAQEKFQNQKPKIKWVLDLDNSKMEGTKEMWEVVIDNILENFLRYAEKEIKVTLKKEKLTFYNDGPQIQKNLMKDMFEPYKKGVKGKFGLGLSIAKKTIELFNYKIYITNEDVGVKFVIR